jgi:hypothetical protein
MLLTKELRRFLREQPSTLVLAINPVMLLTYVTLQHGLHRLPVMGNRLDMIFRIGELN